MSIKEIKHNYEISKEHIAHLEQAGMNGHILSLQRDYIEHVGTLLDSNKRLVNALEEIKRNTKFLQHVSAHGKTFDIADNALQAYKLLEKKD